MTVKPKVAARKIGRTSFHVKITLFLLLHHFSFHAHKNNIYGFSAASVVKAVNKYGLKHFDVDDNRRETYNHLSTSTQEPWVLTTLEDELKELIPVRYYQFHYNILSYSETKV